jgi:hypothetical protein
LVKNELSKNPSYQDHSESNKSYQKRPLSPLGRLPLFRSYGRNAIYELSPLFAGIWGGNDSANFLGCFPRNVEAGESPLITNKVNVVCSDQALPLIIQTHATLCYSPIAISLLAKVSTAYASMLRQFYSSILAPNGWLANAVLVLVPHYYCTRTPRPVWLGFAQFTAPFAGAIAAMRRVCSQHLIFQLWRKYAIGWKSLTHFRGIVRRHLAVGQYRNMLQSNMGEKESKRGIAPLTFFFPLLF